MLKVKSLDVLPDDFTGCYYNEEANSTVYKLNGQYHRLDGPAIVWFNYYGAQEGYFINGLELPKDSYYKHPLVMKHKLENILHIFSDQDSKSRVDKF